MSEPTRQSVLDRLVGLPFAPLGRLRRAMRDPAGNQLRMLREMVSRAAGTSWGREHDLAGVLRSADLLQAFRERVPLSGYEAFRAYIARAREGEADVLWPGRTRHFGISAGTVSSGEVIPVSGAMLRAMTRSSLAPGLQYAARRGPGFLGGKILSVPGGISPDRARPGIVAGEVSGLMASAVPRLLARHFGAVPLEVMISEDWDAKLRRIVRLTARQDIRAIIMVPSWAPLLFDQLMEFAAGATGSRPPGVREVWPRLQVFFSGGVALRSYRPILESYVGHDVDFIESYSASEGFFAFQDRADNPDLLLHLDSGVFYEFVRVEELDRDRPKRYTAADVEPGVEYALFVSTCSGLWGYGVQDVVLFASTSPLRLRVAGRTAMMLDEFGEALYAGEAEQALVAAARLTGAECLHHHVTYAPLRGSIPQHEWLIEFRVPPRDEDAFVAAFDGYLREHNRHYRIRRDPGVLAAPAVTVLPPGTCLDYLRRTRTRVSAQTKLLAMSPKRHVADGLTAAAGRSERTGTI